MESSSIHSYRKLFAYAYLYMSLSEVDQKDITVTMAVSMHPGELLKQLGNDPALSVENVGKGLYYINGERIPVQIIVTKSLSEDENLWLNALRRGLDETTLNHVLETGRKYGADIAAYMYAVLNANKDLLKGDNKMDKRSIMELYKNDPFWIDLFEELGYGNIKNAHKESAKRMLQNGEPYEKIVKYLFIPMEEIAEIEKELN